VDKVGCTPCHNGDGPNVNSVHGAHANYYDANGELIEVHLREEHALFRGPMMQANCLKCHPTAVGLEGAEVAARGETLFIELGCHGCHLTEGYETLAKPHDVPIIGPSLRRIGAKVDPGWLVRWVHNPHEFRPRTRMPNFMFSDQQATQIAAFLLAATKDNSAAWVNEHPAARRAERRGRGGQGQGRGRLGRMPGLPRAQPRRGGGTARCRQGHRAPIAATSAEKTDAAWIYHWIKNPRGYSDIARMPSLRLSDDEARRDRLLLTLGAPTPAPSDLDDQARRSGQRRRGREAGAQVRLRRLPRHPGMELESRIGAELSTYATSRRKRSSSATDRIARDWRRFTSTS
jgi:hypothetical protein